MKYILILCLLIIVALACAGGWGLVNDIDKNTTVQEKTETPKLKTEEDLYLTHEEFTIKALDGSIITCFKFSGIDAKWTVTCFE